MASIEKSVFNEQQLYAYEQFQYIRFRYLFSFNYVIHYYFYVITKLFSFHFLFVISSPNAIF